jgi:hypothetical protein
MACGLAIILRSSFYFFKTPEEWKFIGDTFDVLANFEGARGLVFDGIASTVEFAVPQTTNGDLDEYEATLREKHTISIPGCSTLQRNLFKYIYGSYENDFSLAVPAMLCLEKTYKHMVQLILILQKKDKTRDPDAPFSSVPDKELWNRAAVAFYSVCRSNDPDASKHGWECFQRHVLTTEVSQIPDEKWILILNLMIDKQPDLTAEVARVNTFSVLGQVIIRVMPSLTHRKENWKVLTEITNKVAALAEENLRYGRQGSVKPMFEYTLQTVTYLSNQMLTDEFGGEKRYSKWASDTLLKVLESVGAGGGSDANKALTQKGALQNARDQDDNDLSEKGALQNARDQDDNDFSEKGELQNERDQDDNDFAEETTSGPIEDQ